MISTAIPGNDSLAEQTTILLADDHPVFRKAVRRILEAEDDFIVVAEASNGVEAVSLANKLVPKVVVMDISMPKMKGLEATRQIKARHGNNVAVLILTVHEEIEHVLGILEAGAAGYLTKRANEEEIIAAIRSIRMRETVMAADIFEQVLQYILRYPLSPLALKSENNLTPRELEVLKLVAKGLSNKDISQALNLSISTVKAYMMGIFSKLNVTSRTEAVITSIRARFIDANDIK